MRRSKPSEPQESTGLQPEAFAALWYLKGKGMDEAKAQAVAQAAAAVFRGVSAVASAVGSGTASAGEAPRSHDQDW